MSKITTNQFIEDMNKIYNGELEVLSEYVNMQTPVKIKHIPCGAIYEYKPSNLYYNKLGCPRCCKCMNRSFEDWKYLVNHAERNGCDYTLLNIEHLQPNGNDTKSRTRMTLRHEVCGEEFTMTTDNFFAGKCRCPKCFGIKSYTTEEFNKIMLKNFHGDLILLEDFKGTEFYNKVKCMKCGKEYKALGSNLYSGYGCSCNSILYRGGTSIGEDHIEEFLKLNNIQYIKQYKFDDLKARHNIYYRYDFGVLNEDESLNCLIEFDGRQHFETWWIDDYSESALKDRQENDRVKNNYCKEHNIKLIRIPYNQMDQINTILESELIDLISKNNRRGQENVKE